MKILQTLGIFLLAFLVGSFFAVMIKFVSFTKSEPNILPEEMQICPVNSNIEESKSQTAELNLRVFNVEGFWDESIGQFNKRLLETGEASNGEDFKMKTGETWLGLFNENGKDFLRPTKVKISQTVEKINDFNWVEISVKNKITPLFLIKKSKNLKVGNVKTLFHPKTWQETGEDVEFISMKNGFDEKFNLEGKEYTLRVEKALSEKQEPILVLLLETENKSQMIHYIGFVEEGGYTANLLWVGDLDDDGKLDLYMEFYDYEKGGYNTGLFLSSEAQKGKLVRKIEFSRLSAC